MGNRQLLDRRLQWLRDQDSGGLLRNGLRGVEKETLRVDDAGQISLKPHPQGLGSALTHECITTDYSEALLELVTPAYASNWETLQFLCDTHCFVHRKLEDEMLWPMSMPCIVNANETIPIADYGPSNLGMMKTIYRRGLGFRYGRAMQAIAGIHFNYSPPASLWAPLREFERFDGSLRTFKSEMIMGLVRNYRRLAWLVIYLFGASPAFCKSFRSEGHPLLSELNKTTWYAKFATSLRMSDLGYRNKTQARLNISANSLDEYVQGLTAAVTTPDPVYKAIGIRDGDDYKQLNANILQIENEYYTSIRPKPRRSSRRATAGLREGGVEYVEIRGLDLNPMDPVGMNQNQMRLLEALLVYCLLSPSPPIDSREQAEIDERDLRVAREGRRPGLRLTIDKRERTLADVGEEHLEAVGRVAEVLDATAAEPTYSTSVAGLAESLRAPDTTPSARLLQSLEAEGAGFFEYSLKLARRFRSYFLSLPLGRERLEELEHMTARSLSVAATLERDDKETFEAYLARHAASV